jgi:hypothetical protein
MQQNIRRNTTPYCGTCHKAGKSFSEYTNHWTRSEPGPNGVIICPLILNTMCSRCKQLGHWVKYCTTKLFINPRSWSNVLRMPPPTPQVIYTENGSYTRPPSPDYPPPSNYNN